jgi:glycosyltransferase involved in cell wall biosynthesis
VPITVQDNTGVLAIVAAHNEAERIADTLAALAGALPGVALWVADDGSSDGTGAIAERAGATVVRSEHGAPRRDGGVGKGGAVTDAARSALVDVTAGEDPVVLVCDGDLGESARELAVLVDAIRHGKADLAVAVFVTRAGGGFGLALTFARWAIRRCCGLSTRAPISGQRAMRAGALRDVLPFAPGYGMEVGMTIDAVRAGHRVVEVDLDLTHRATGRTFAGFAHRARQLIDIVRAYLARR